LAIFAAIRHVIAKPRLQLKLSYGVSLTVARVLYKVAALTCSERLIMLCDRARSIGAQRPARDNAGNKKGGLALAALCVGSASLAAPAANPTWQSGRFGEGRARAPFREAQVP